MKVTYISDSPTRVGEVKLADSGVPDSLKMGVIDRNAPIRIGRPDSVPTDIVAVLGQPTKSVSANTFQEASREETEDAPMRPRKSRKAPPAQQPPPPPPPPAAPARDVVKPLELVPSRAAVVFSSPLFGRMKCNADVATVSERLVTVGFLSQDFELELPAATRENPLTVQIGEETYTCVSGQWHTDIPLRSASLRLLLFVRIDN